MSDEIRNDTAFVPEEPEQPSPEGEYDDSPRRTGSHPVNVGHLVMGLVFLAIVGVWALIQTDAVTGRDIRWLLPLPWVIGGAIGLAATAVSGVRRHGAGR